MTNDVEYMKELWDLVAQYVPVPERKSFAHELIELADDHGFSDGFEDGDFTGPLAKAAKDFYRFDDDESGDDDEH